MKKSQESRIDDERSLSDSFEFNTMNYEDIRPNLYPEDIHTAPIYLDIKDTVA